MNGWVRPAAVSAGLGLAGLLLLACSSRLGMAPAPVTPSLPALALPQPSSSSSPSAAPVSPDAGEETGSVPAVPTATRPPAVADTPSLSDSAREDTRAVTLTIVYDNNAYDPALRTAWGFACWVETPDANVLFDTGGDAPTLLGNLQQLGLDPLAVDAVVLSHAHGDHVGGLRGLLATGARPTLYAPAAFPAALKAQLGTQVELVEVNGPHEIVPGVYSSGQVGTDIVEQALVVETPEGLVVVTGCAHPGVVEMVRRGTQSVEGEVTLVVGGFHLREASEAQLESVVAGLHGLGVVRVAPTHCTGDRAREVFAGAFGADFSAAGAGWQIVLGVEPPLE